MCEPIKDTESKNYFITIDFWGAILGWKSGTWEGGTPKHNNEIGKKSPKSSFSLNYYIYN